MRNVFGLKIKSATPLNKKMQITIEREMDFLFLIESESSEKFLLHIEVETGDNPDMIY